MIDKILGFFSRITVRLLTFNVLIVFLPIAALLYLDTYEKQLLRSLEHALVQQGRIMASALSGRDPLEADSARRILQQLEQRHEARMRVVDDRGRLLADSSRLGARGEAIVGEEAEVGRSEISPPRQANEVPPEIQTNGSEPIPAERRLLYRFAIYPIQLYRRLFRPPEAPLESAEFYVNTEILLGPEIREALAGRYGAMTRISTGGQRSVTLYSAIPVRSGEAVVGAVLVSQSTYRILRDLYELRLEIFTIFLISLGVAVALSLLASTTIAVPVRKLRRQAREILDHRGRLRGHIRYNRRRDEIGDLSRSLEEMTRKLQRHIEFVESFASDISHEFMNPLASIRSAAEMIDQAKSVQDRNRFLALIQKEVQRMQHLLAAVREISLIDAQLEDEQRTPIEITPIVRQVVEAHRLRRNSSLPVRLIENAGSLTVSMAPERLTQVLENLLENALSFASAEVRIELSRDHNQGMITVQDDGPGIPEQHLEKIFHRFFSYRPDSAPAESNERPEHHLGLGLAIVRAIVEGYGGRVTAANGAATGRQLKGACFRVHLPLVSG
ncbi:MAG: sensor N-terminal transmembrane domain-containing protein [Spirochaetaceae bacterium]|nr:MAG: sensor N-terminal transmembrane domain-containing protein [Spirochaetaceae bacterium]